VEEVISVLKASIHDLERDFQAAVTQEGLGVAADGNVFVHEELVSRWARRVCTDTMLLLAKNFDVKDTLAIAVVEVEPDEDDVTLGDLVEGGDQA